MQLSVDVVRNSLIYIGYEREDESLHSNLWADYRNLKYDVLPLDRKIKTFGASLNYPVTQLLSGGVFVNFNSSTQLDTSREDKNFTFGTNINYLLTA